MKQQKNNKEILNMHILHIQLLSLRRRHEPENTTTRVGSPHATVVRYLTYTH